MYKRVLHLLSKKLVNLSQAQLPHHKNLHRGRRRVSLAELVVLRRKWPMMSQIPSKVLKILQKTNMKKTKNQKLVF
jgi:hypothetical protein